jgi:hypothetical protein
VTKPPERQARDDKNDRVERQLELLWNDYAYGDITLQKLLHLALVVLHGTVPDKRRRDELLGKLMRHADAVEPERRGRGPKGLPPSLRIAAHAATLYVPERLRSARSSPQTLDAVIQTIRQLWGVRLTPDQVKEFLRPRPRPPRRRG